MFRTFFLLLTSFSIIIFRNLSDTFNIIIIIILLIYVVFITTIIINHSLPFHFHSSYLYTLLRGEKYQHCYISLWL